MNERAFSLIELMVVVAILSFVLALLIPRFLKHQEANHPPSTVKKSSQTE